MFEDAMVSLGLIPDDSPEYVARAIIEVCKSSSTESKKKASPLGSKEDPKNPDYLIITIKPCKLQPIPLKQIGNNMLPIQKEHPSSCRKNS